MNKPTIPLWLTPSEATILSGLLAASSIRHKQTANVRRISRHDAGIVRMHEEAAREYDKLYERLCASIITEARRAR